MSKLSMLLVSITTFAMLSTQQLGAEGVRGDPGDGEVNFQLHSQDVSNSEALVLMQPQDSDNSDGTLQLTADSEHTLANAAPATRAALCVQNSGRRCKDWRQGTIVDTIMQCRHHTSYGLRTSSTNVSVRPVRAMCSTSTKSDAAEGVCMCTTGFCADVDLKCYPQEYTMLPAKFTITTQVYGVKERLYMDSDGTVKSGMPADPRAAQWRISVTKSGAKLLSTEMYLQTVLQEFESCSSKTDEITGMTWSSCDLMVGHTEEPRADEMGWLIELYDPNAFSKARKQMRELNPDQDAGMTKLANEWYVQLRSKTTRDVLYISPVTKTAKACQATSKSCPGAYGALKFDPPLIGYPNFTLDDADAGLPQGIRTFLKTVCALGVLVLLLCCLHFCVKGKKKTIHR